MTRSRYLLARLAQSFGLSMTSRYASNAASELHLLREAEEMLGRLSWRSLENLEELSIEYWNLRKFSKQHEALTREINQANNVLQQSHDERAGLLERVADSTKDLVTEREELIEKSEGLSAERDEVIHEARLVKRRHDGLKAKLEVLIEEGSGEGEAAATTRSELAKLKSSFSQLKTRRNELTERIQELDGAIEAMEESIENHRKGLREEALGSYQSIGKANRDISSCRAELGMVEKEMSLLFAEIGRFVALNPKHEGCSKAAREHRGLIQQMVALRQSVMMNNHLAGRGGPPTALNN